MKKVTIAFSLLVFILSLASCGSNSAEVKTENTESENQTETDTKLSEEEKADLQSFTEFAVDFMSKIKKEDVFSYINQDYGLFILHNPGTFPLIQSVNNLKEMESILYRETLTSKYSVKEENIPEFSCENNRWSKDGCFCKRDKYTVIADTYDILLEYEMINKEDLNQEDYDKAKKLSKLQTYCIYATDIVTGFYFVKIENQYYLYLIDAFDHCSA